MDLFPEVQEAVTLALSALQIHSHYPFSSFFTLLGFFIVLTVEQIVNICQNRRHHLRSPYSTNNLHHNHRLQQSEDDDQHQVGHGHSHLPGMSNEPGHSSALRIMLLLIALSVHSVFEGLAVGLQRTVAEVVTLFSALSLHKVIIAASIGMSLVAARGQQARGITRAQWIGTLVFALASPVGVLIGWALIAQRSSPSLLVSIAVLQGLACGTFFFVVFCEMLPHEFFSEDRGSGKVRDRLGKLISLVLGFALIAGYIAFEPK